MGKEVRTKKKRKKKQKNTLMLSDSCLSLIETVGYSKGQPTPYSNNAKNVAFAIQYHAKDTAFYNIRNIDLPQNQLSDP